MFHSLKHIVSLSSDKTVEQNRISVLKRKLSKKIDQIGSISFHDFMEASLYDPNAGFYIDRVTFSEERTVHGDFITAPKTFSPYYGQAIASLISQLDAGNKIRGGIQRIVSIAAGDGTLDRDLLDWLQQHNPTLYKSVQYISVEISPRQIGLQKKLLGKHVKKVRFIQQSGLDYLREQKGKLSHAFIFSNEWLDTLPVYIVKKKKNTWKEVVITKNWRGKFVKTIAELQQPEKVQKFLQYAEIVGRKYLKGTSYENYPINIHSQMIDIAEALSQSLVSGFSLMIDYGTIYSEPPQSILIFTRNKTLKNFLQYPGSVDITTYVDWDIWLQASKKLSLISVTCDMLLVKYFSSLPQSSIQDSLRKQLKNPALLQSSGGYILSQQLAKTLAQAKSESAYWFEEGIYALWKYSPFPANSWKTKLWYIKNKFLAGSKIEQ